MKIRLPAAFIILPIGFCGMFAIIWGGVAVSQKMNADWTVCRWFLFGLAAFVAIYVFGRVSGLIDWIADEELVGMEKADRDKEAEREVQAILAAADDGTLEEKYRFKRYWHYVFTALVIVLIFHEYFIRYVRTANGELSPSLLGFTFGTWTLFRRTWTGFELLVVGGCVAALVYYLRKGIALLVRANKR
ncbi:MAG: hypothetical protein HY923_00415 [Elusimicrobia bacterium]|nr:hypothetical protein [Elusimicrobiota bacterium]